MKIKTKLLLGIGLLFLMIVLLTTLSTFFLNKLSGDTKNILVANYNTIDYCRQMQIELNKGFEHPAATQSFRQYLTKQQGNITEVGELQMTDKLEADFENLLKDPKNDSVHKTVQKDITDIMLLNMQAIQRKSKVAENTADFSVLWVTVIGTICFLVAFTMLINFPGNIANPIKELTGSIKDIAAQNYSRRINFDKNNEFGELASSFNTMAQKLEEYRAGNLDKIMVAKKRIETLVDNMNDPVIILDENMQVLFMNNYANKITGLTGEVTTGKQIQDLAIHNDLIRTLAQDLFSEKPEAAIVKREPVKIYADNKESYFEKEIIPIKIIPTGEKEEKLIGNVIMLQNITPYKELDFAKTNFIATVSHELKTPISSIKMSLQLLENKQVGSLNEEQEGLLESIKEDANRLLKITGELLNMTQVESGTMSMNMRPSNPSEMVDYAINATKAAAEQKQVKVNVNIQENIPFVMADSEKTSWVLTNLLTNAIRYSYDNSVIYIQAIADGKQVKFSVTDTGQGIAPQYIDKIFDRYFRIPGTRKEGTGLGLSISKEFIEAQGGRIAVQSDFGAGSIFSFSLNAAS